METVMKDVQAAKDLGWLSIGIGLLELFATKPVEKLMGLDNHQNSGILRAMGAREVMHGVDILSHDDPTPGVWARVAGDVLDTALLGVAAMKTKSPARFAMVAGAVLAIGVADMVVATKLSAQKQTTWDRMRKTYLPLAMRHLR
jgi:hypothetical protein